MKKTKTVLYVVRYPLLEDDHLKTKFKGQLNAFRQLGYHTLFLGYDKESFFLVDGKKKTKVGKPRFWLPNYIHTFLYPDLYKAAIKVIESGEVDIVYYRNAPVFHKTISMAKCIKKNNCKFVYEIPTYNPNSKEKSLSWIRSVYNTYSTAFAKKLETMPDLYVFMGDGNLETFHGVPAIRIENGVDTDTASLRNPVNDPGTIHVLALSSMSYWHGYDRLIRSLAEYKGSSNVLIHMVGNDGGGCMKEWKDLTYRHQLTEKVLFHGPMYREELDQMFDLCDIGVSSMGMYRKGFEDTSELKIREYISRGLPIVSSVYDAALEGLDNDLWYQVTNDDSIPSMDEIVRFAQKVKNDTTAKDRLRAYAAEELTWKAQYKKVFDRLEGVE